jgi:hypothetical protein
MKIYLYICFVFTILSMGSFAYAEGTLECGKQAIKDLVIQNRLDEDYPDLKNPAVLEIAAHRWASDYLVARYEQVQNELYRAAYAEIDVGPNSHTFDALLGFSDGRYLKQFSFGFGDSGGPVLNLRRYYRKNGVPSICTGMVYGI